MEFFDNLEPLLRSFWYIALPASAIFLIQSVMTFAGADSHGDVSDTDTVTHEGDFQLFSVRNMINFLLGVSWTGISCYDYISNPFVLIGLSVIVGSVFVYFFFLIINQVKKLSEDNTFLYTDTVNKTAEVYFTIPSKMSGKGKITVNVKGSIHELDAMTEDEIAINTHAIVRVVRIESENILIVTKL